MSKKRSKTDLPPFTLDPKAVTAGRYVVREPLILGTPPGGLWVTHVGAHDALTGPITFAESSVPLPPRSTN